MAQINDGFCELICFTIMVSRVALTPKEWGIPEIISLDATINNGVIGIKGDFRQGSKVH